MEVSAASVPGSSTVENQDGFYSTRTMAIVLDGLSVPAGLPMGCRHSTPWLVHQIGTGLISRAEGAEVSLATALAATIEAVNDLHGESCDLSRGTVPASTAVILRQRGEHLDYLVLSDSVLLLDIGDELKVVTDNRVEDVARESMKSALSSPIGTREHAEKVSELVRVQQGLRNVEAGYWVASTAPEAASQAITGTVSLSRVKRAALLTDGATRLVDTFSHLTWSQLFQVLEDSGPSALISKTREQEDADPEGVRWPRFKKSDDATALLVSSL
ncbi:hypothetical protein [Streptomyces xiamenensis]|uniref:hypothetical protein n=1 Tax=Streptomyces xiamenensis TaxID=408015 RepID=UPI0035E3478F